MENETILEPINIVSPSTTIETGQGVIRVIHEITLGDLLISTLLLSLISFVVISRVVRR